MKIDLLYNRCWNDHPTTLFEAYDRNLILSRFFPKTNSKPKVLDLGCGDGAVSAWLSGLGYSVTAADFNEIAVKAALKRGLVDVRLVDVENPLPFLNNSFDTVFFGDVIEHVFDTEGVLLEINRVLAPGGKLVLSCPNVGYIGFRLKYLFRGSIRSLEFANQEPWEQEHIRFLNYSDLRSLLSKVGFKINTLFGYIQVIEATKL